MSIGKLENVMNTTIATNTREPIKKQPQPQPVKVDEDVVTISNSEDNLAQIYLPPLFPIGDTQSIFKIEK